MTKGEQDQTRRFRLPEKNNGEQLQEDKLLEQLADDTQVMPGDAMLAQDAATTVVARTEFLDESTNLELPNTQLSSTETVTEKNIGIEPETIQVVHSSIGAIQHQSFVAGSLIKDRFSLVEEIGHGGMGVVYTARDMRKEEAGDSDSLIAIKLLSEDFKKHPLALRMLQQESKKSQKLAHPNIVNVYDFDRDQDTVFMTMELLEGRPLREYLEEIWGSTTPFKELEPIISGIVAGLDYAHQHGIIHSDLKPANIYLTEEEGVKLLDFGIARAVINSERTQSNATKAEVSNLTEGLVVLTPSYASPEMFDEQPPDPRDDIYALACMTYQLLGGRHPYYNRPSDKAKEEGLTPKRIEGLSDRQWKGLLHGLSLERDLRTPTAKQFLAEISPPRREPWRVAAMSIALFSLMYVLYVGLKPAEKPHIFYNPLQAEAMSEQLAAEVSSLLEIAEVQLLTGRLLEPSGSSAHDLYDEVLASKNPYNREAIAGMKKLVIAMADEAERLITEGQFMDAGQHVKVGLSIDEKNPRLLELEKKLQILK